MKRIGRNVAMTAFAAAYCLSFGQTGEQPVTLIVEIDNAVLYRDNTTDIARIAKVPTPTTSVNISFRPGINVADIVAVNGKPARGTFSNTFVAMPYRANPAAGQPIADANGTATFYCTWHVMAPDGTYVGTLHDSGGGPSREHAVVGGTGAFLGVAGVHRDGEQISPWRFASTEEDPANRRAHGGGRSRYVFYLYPRLRPTVDLSPAGPSVLHSDFSPVTGSSPARAGEVLIVAARHLGPTQPDLLPPGTRPFKADPFEVVNSPVEVTVNGQDAEVINKIGWPGTSDLYRVDFRVPSGLAPGMASIQLTAAWIPGPEVKIPVQ
jgi:hypothetical protein